MKAMIIRDFGGTDVFEAAELPTPELKPGHVLVRIAATSVNTVDIMIWVRSCLFHRSHRQF